ncbi:MAG: sugar phosphate isomerase/epimerase, partial [Clostridia bacterium]|nr:sugar phosphate isomerase/epimerase [Clostridia bacterium]
VMAMLPSYHGFCWDCGHNLCYTPMEDMMAKYGDRLICTHIHDNRGVTRPGDIHYRDDLHLLPFDGNLDWEWFADKIKESKFDGPLTLELSLAAGKGYTDMPLQEFFNDAYRRAQKLLSMCK